MVSSDYAYNVELFKYLTPDERRRVLTACTPKEYKAGDIIFEANTVGNEMYIIESGRIKIYKVFEGVELTFAELGEGEAFGEMSLIDEYPRSAAARAIQPASLLTFSRQSFDATVADNADLGVRLFRAVSEVFSKRMRKTDKLLETYYLVNKALISNEEFRQLYISIHT